MSVKVKSITIFPIKSLDGCLVTSSGFTKRGSLQFDREYALVDSDHKMINAKKYASIQKVRSSFSLGERKVSISAPNFKNEIFNLNENNQLLNEWFSEYFKQSVSLVRNCEIGFPDDVDAFGPTLCSTESLRAISDWYGGENVELIRKRFRCNIEIEGCPAFWEDHLVGKKGTEPSFKIGEVDFKAVNICQRCVVPTRNPVTADENNEFINLFKRQRENAIYSKTSMTQFNHFYRFSVNTKTNNSYHKKITIGDDLWSELKTVSKVLF